jgi:hypothetical protein
MPIRLIDPSKPFDWVLPKDRIAEVKDSNGVVTTPSGISPDATIIGLVALSEGEARKFVLKRGTTSTGLDEASQHDVLTTCIKYFKNITDLDGKTREVTDAKEIDQIIGQLSSVDAASIALACISESLLDAGTIKNFDASPASPHS